RRPCTGCRRCTTAAELPGGWQPGLVPGGLEQLDGVPRGVLDEDLLAAHAGDDLVAEPGALRPECADETLKVGDLEGEAVPPSGRWPGAVGHGLAAARASAGRAEHQAQVTPGQHGEGRSGVHDLGKAEEMAVERDRLIDVVDDVPDADAGHLPLLSSCSTYRGVRHGRGGPCQGGEMTDFISQNLTGSRFEDVYLTGARFHDVDLSNAQFRLVDMTGVTIRGAAVVNVDISGEVENLRVNGVDVMPLVEAELNRRYPDRAMMRP